LPSFRVDTILTGSTNFLIAFKNSAFTLIVRGFSLF
jgi:hypothetical protein